jgi:hypothetical protein
VVEFIKKHKVPIIILAVSVGLYLLYDYLAGGSSSGNSGQDAADATDAADQAALQDELASLASGSGGALSSPIASSPAITGTVPSTASSPTSTGTVAATAASTVTPSPSSTTPGLTTPIPGSGVTGGSGAYGAVAGSGITLGSGAGGAQSLQPGGGVETLVAEPDNTADNALLVALQQGSPSAIAAMNSYNGFLQESDPQLYSQLEAAGSDPYAVYLEQQQTGGTASAAENALSNSLGQNSPFVLPTEPTGDSGTTGDGGGESGTAGGSGSSSTGVRPTDIGVQLGGSITPPKGGPGNLLAGGGLIQNQQRGLTIALSNPPTAPIKPSPTTVTPTQPIYVGPLAGPLPPGISTSQFSTVTQYQRPVVRPPVG